MFCPGQSLGFTAFVDSFRTTPFFFGRSTQEKTPTHTFTLHYFRTHSPHLHPVPEMMKSGALLLFFFLFVSTSTAQTPATFRCNTRTRCQALIDYVPINATTYSDIITLFGVNNHTDILAANNLSLSTPRNAPVAPNQKVRIPFPCVCRNGTGISDNRPRYTVKAGDGLDFIARSIFSNLLTYQQIASVNNIPNPNLIEVGQQLVIPLPCSCDDVDGMKVVHYGYVVPPGSDVSRIASDYDTTEQTLLRLNGLADASDLQAGAVIDVPLRACTSVISNTSLDASLLVASGTSAFTANNCVQCKCERANNFTLQCDPSPTVIRIANWSRCPSMRCEGNGGLTIGNTSSSTSCSRTTCAYTGYTNQAILTNIVNVSTCPTGTPSNDARKDGLQWLSWTWLLISLELGLLSFGLL